MSDPEFERELSPDQLRKALSLLDGTTGGEGPNPHVEDLNPAEKSDPEAAETGTAMATLDRLAAAEGPPPSPKHLNLAAAAFCGLGIAAVAGLMLLPPGERALTAPPLSGVALGQIPSQLPAQLAKDASPALAVNPSPDRSPGGPERQPSQQETTGSNPLADANRTRALATAPLAATATAVATKQAWRGASRKSPEARWHTRAVRVAAVKRRSWRHHWQARTEANSGECFFFMCLPWKTQRVVYEPPRNMNQ